MQIGKRKRDFVKSMEDSVTNKDEEIKVERQNTKQ